MQDLLEWMPLLIGGLGRTLWLFATVFVVGSAGGIVIALARLSAFRPVRYLATIYVETFRGISLYVVLFWLYFALPFMGLHLTIWWAAFLGCTLNHAAYFSEYVRAAVLSISVSQTEAAVALGMNGFQRARYVVLPQALAALIPLMGNELVMLLKGTSTVSLIGLPELTEQAHSIIVSTYQAVPVLVVVLCIYFVIAQLIILITERFEYRFSRWRLPIGPDVGAQSLRLAK